MNMQSLRKNERGTTIAEFAVVALLFFVIIFGIIEFGRLLYTHNALTDATRRGARFAALHKEAEEDLVRKEVVYGSRIDADGNPTGPPLINGLTEDMVEVVYLGKALNADGSLRTNYGTNLGTATVTINDYQFDLLIPVIGRRLTLPTYSTTLTAESAGEPVANINSPPPAP